MWRRLCRTSEWKFLLRYRILYVFFIVLCYILVTRFDPEDSTNTLKIKNGSRRVASVSFQDILKAGVEPRPQFENLLPEKLVNKNTNEKKPRLPRHPTEFLDLMKHKYVPWNSPYHYRNERLVENENIPESWVESPEVKSRLENRKKRVKEVCHKYGLDEPSPNNTPNSWEFMIHKEHGLTWCNIFKAASSTWIYNFNVLAGYSDSVLLRGNKNLLDLARIKYPRPTVEELMEQLQSNRHSIAFMIARHPLERLVSAYRDKIESGTKFYKSLQLMMMSAYPETSQKTIIVDDAPKRAFGNRFFYRPKRQVIASFRQFVQFIINSYDKGETLNEHWTPMYSFCSVCLVDFDVFAKVETLDEDGNYVIFKSGIQDYIRPKRINRSRNQPTNEVANSFICQLTPDQFDGIVRVYQIDFQIFDYDSQKYYTNCTGPNIQNY